MTPLGQDYCLTLFPNSPSSTSNYPELTSAELGSVKVSGRVKGKPNCDYRVEVFVEPPGADELTFAGKFTVHTDSTGVGNFQSVELLYTANIGDRIEANAYSKDCGDGTSEMSPSVTLTAPAPNTFIEIEQWEYHQKQNAGPLSIKVKRFGDTSGVSSEVVSTAAHESESYAGMAEPNLLYALGTTCYFPGG